MLKFYEVVSDSSHLRRGELFLKCNRSDCPYSLQIKYLEKIIGHKINVEHVGCFAAWRVFVRNEKKLRHKMRI